MPADPIAFLNGRFVPLGELTLSFADAGFVFGATVTDFCRTYRHRLFRWPDHLARFRHDCGACRVPLTHPDAELTAAAERLVSHNAALIPESDDLALVTFATPGPLGYLTGTPETGPPTVGMHTFPLPLARYRRFFTDGVTLAVAGLFPAQQYALVPPGVKHRSRLHWWLADHAVRDPASPFHCPGAVAVLLDGHGTAADTAIGGVLAVAGNRVIRPAVGTVLESVSVKVVGELCGKLGLTFADAPLDFGSLARPVRPEERGTVIGSVSEMLLAGSGFGVAGVRRFVSPGGHRDFAWPGPVYRALTAAWSEVVGFDVVGQFAGGAQA